MWGRLAFRELITDALDQACVPVLAQSVVLVSTSVVCALFELWNKLGGAI